MSLPRSPHDAASLAPRLHGLTVLRFFAALWVLLFHLQSLVPLPFGYWTWNFFSNGAYAMSLFFILSGIVLTYGYRQLQGGEAIKRFYLSRLARIYPAYAVVHVVTLLWLAIPLPQEWIKWVFVNGLSTLGLQAWFVHAVGYGANNGTWSISVEFFFYALFPVLLPVVVWLGTVFGNGRLCLWHLLLIGFWGLAGYALTGGDSFLYYTLPFVRLPEFTLGIVLGLTLLTPSQSKVPPQLGLVLALASLTLAAVNPIARWDGLWIRANLVVVPSIAWLLYAVGRTEQHLKPAWRSLPGRIGVYLGESSYCLFLAHLIPMLFLDSPGGQALGRKILTQNLAVELWIVFITVSFALAVALHELVEKPARRALLRRWRVTA